MIAVGVRFLTGRYHATPWGRHVNEGAVEWPPSPWRFLRALVACWRRTLADLPSERVEPLLRKLATPPEFILPPASVGHTRHYMPWFKKGPHDRTLVFDAFAAVSREAWTIVRWPNESLDAAERADLERILGNLNSFGRAESWCEASLLDETGPASGQEGGRRSAPLGMSGASEDREIVRVLCADPAGAFEPNEAAAGESDWKLCIETLQLHRERWSDPPGSRWVRYERPRDCFRVDRVSPGRARRRDGARVQVIRYALDSTVLPPATETLPLAESARRALMARHGVLTGRDGIRGRSEVLSGKDERGVPLEGHGHAYFLPTDEDGDGRIDHLTLFARIGFEGDELRAADELNVIRWGRRGEERHPLRVLLLGTGALEDYAPGPLRASSVWVSATPYLATRHPKTRGRHRIDVSSLKARADFLEGDLRRQLRSMVAVLGSGAVEVEPLVKAEAFSIGKRWRPIQFKCFRRKAGDDGGWRLAGSFRIRFAEPVSGPLSLGWAAHFGMGMFVPDGGR